MARYDKNSINKIASEFGYRLHEFSDENANDIIAKNFQSKANNFMAEHCFHSSVRYRQGIYSEVFFVQPLSAKSLGLDIIVVPVDNVTIHHFIIFISIKALAGISSLFAELSIGPEIKSVEARAAVANLKFASEIYPRVTSALLFIFLHELAHLLRGHLPYYFKEEYWIDDTRGRCAFHLLEEIEGKNWDMMQIHRALEMDADLVAFGLLIELFANPELRTADMVPDELLQNPSLASEAVYILIRLLEIWRRALKRQPYDPNKAGHPHPDIRQIFYEAWLKARQKDLSVDLDLLEAFFTGSNSAQQLLKTFGPQFLPDMEYLRHEGAERIITEYDILKQHLEDKVRKDLEILSV